MKNIFNFNIDNKETIQKVKEIDDFYVIFCQSSTKLISKLTFKEIKFIPINYSNCFQNNEEILLISLENNLIHQYNIFDLNYKAYNIPPNHNLISVKFEKFKQFIVAITKINDIESYSVIFWNWENSQFVYAFEKENQLENIKILNEKLLIIYGRNYFKIFDSNKIEFIQDVQISSDIKNTFLIENNILLLIFGDDTHYKINLSTKETKMLCNNTKKKCLLYFDVFKILINASDFENFSKIKF